MSFVARLQREIKAHPAKGAGLGVLLIVAAYFWAPLVRGLIAPEDAASEPSPTPASTAAAPATTTSTPSAPAPATAAGAAAYDWRKHASALDGDPNMQSTDDLPLPRDPFASEKSAEQKTIEAQATQPAVEAKPLTPQEAGLVLTTTFLGTRKKIAEIGGETYSVGDQIHVATDEHNESFRVLAIYPRRVILEGRGQQFELRIPRPLIDSVEETRTSRHELPPAEEEATGETEEDLFGEPPAERPTDSPRTPQELTD
ncbi:MAG: hypothetical protein AB7O59_12930 [Pirellulales bacterium]